MQVVVVLERKIMTFSDGLDKNTTDDLCRIINNAFVNKIYFYKSGLKFIGFVWVGLKINILFVYKMSCVRSDDEYHISIMFVLLNVYYTIKCITIILYFPYENT